MLLPRSSVSQGFKNLLMKTLQCEIAVLFLQERSIPNNYVIIHMKRELFLLQVFCDEGWN